jgi:ribosomal protein S27AE
MENKEFNRSSLIEKITMSCPFCGAESFINIHAKRLIGEKVGCDHFGMIPAFQDNGKILIITKKIVRGGEHDDRSLSKQELKRLFIVAQARVFLDLARDLSVHPEDLEQKILNSPDLFEKSGIKLFLRAWKQTRG